MYARIKNAPSRPDPNSSGRSRCQNPRRNRKKRNPRNGTLAFSFLSLGTSFSVDKLFLRPILSYIDEKVNLKDKNSDGMINYF